MFLSICLQEMLAAKDTMRNNDLSNWTYHDRVFNNEINLAIRSTDEHYENAMFREGLRTGFYELQVRIC